MKKAFPSTPKRMGSGTGGGGWKEPQPWQVLKAVESKDIMYLMEVRDRAFHVRVASLVLLKGPNADDERSDLSLNGLAVATADGRRDAPLARYADRIES